MDIDNIIAVVNNPVRRKILYWLKDKSNFQPAIAEHAGLNGVCFSYIQKKTGLSQSTISNYMKELKQAGLVISERHGKWTLYSRDEDAISSFFKNLKNHF